MPISYIDNYLLKKSSLTKCPSINDINDLMLDVTRHQGIPIHIMKEIEEKKKSIEK